MLQCWYCGMLHGICDSGRCSRNAKFAQPCLLKPVSVTSGSGYFLCCLLFSSSSVARRSELSSNQIRRFTHRPYRIRDIDFIAFELFGRFRLKSWSRPGGWLTRLSSFLNTSRAAERKQKNELCGGAYMAYSRVVAG
jgi:hypothetical protein